MRRWVIPMSGSRRHASSTASRFIIGSPIPMHAVVDGIEPPEVERLVDDLAAVRLPRTSSARCAERAGEEDSRTATRRRSSGARPGNASGPPRSGGPAVRNSALTVPSFSAPRARARGSSREPPREPRPRPGRFVIVGDGAPGRPFPDLIGTVAGLATLGEGPLGLPGPSGECRPVRPVPAGRGDPAPGERDHCAPAPATATPTSTASGQPPRSRRPDRRAQRQAGDQRGHQPRECLGAGSMAPPARSTRCGW